MNRELLDLLINRQYAAYINFGAYEINNLKWEWTNKLKSGDQRRILARLVYNRTVTEKEIKRILDIIHPMIIQVNVLENTKEKKMHA